MRRLAAVRHRVPAYRRLRRRVVRGLRSLPGAQRVARAVLGEGSARVLAAGRSAPGVPGVDIRAGRFFPQGRGRRLPIVVLVATGVAEGQAEHLARAVEHAQHMTGSFRPLFVIDSGDFGPFRRRSYAVEHLVPRSAYTRLQPHDSYEEYVLGRVSDIARAYGAASVVPLPPGRPDALDAATLRLVGALPVPGR